MRRSRGALLAAPTPLSHRQRPFHPIPPCAKVATYRIRIVGGAADGLSPTDRGRLAQRVADQIHRGGGGRGSGEGIVISPVDRV